MKLSSAARAKAWRADHPDRVWATNRRKRLQAYGITPERYDELLRNQDGRCGICRKRVVGVLSVDHDHKTGDIRGLLCVRCNSGIGFFQESADLLERAATYVRIGGYET